MKKLKVYLDTSVFNFIFAEDAPDFQQVTIDFFENIAPAFNLYISDVVIMEINKVADENHRDRLLSVIKDNNVVVLPSQNIDEIEELANYYLEKGLLPQNKLEDALHVAYATFYDMDLLLSWNFRHLANINREAKILIANSEQGYRYPLRILSPLEVSNES